MDDPYLVAIEQYLFWSEKGLSHEEMLLAIKVMPPPYGLTSHMVVAYLEEAHKSLRRDRRRAA